MPNPLLDFVSLPRFDEIEPDQIAPAIQSAIDGQRDAVAQAIGAHSGSFEDVWMPLERASNAIDSIWSAVSHLHGVADTPELRTAHADGEAKLIVAGMEYAQNRELYDSLIALTMKPEFAGLDAADQVAVKLAIRDFTLSGVGLDTEARLRFREVSIELSSISTEFENAVLDATDAWTELVTDEALLAGVPNADKAMLRVASARSGGPPSWRITLQQPSVSAILTFAKDRELRARVYQANATRASDQGPHAGRFDNSDRIAKILKLRSDAAGLLGFSDYVAMSLETKMASSAHDVLAFLRDIARRARPVALAELDDLRAYSVDRLGMDELQAWDVAFVSNQLRKERFAIDEEELRAFFPVERVMAGWRNLLENLFGIRIIQRDDVALQTSDATYFDVVDENGATFAGLYLDLHARPGKRGGAWMAPARPFVEDGDTISMPVAYLVCNFSPVSDDVPALLSHHDIVVLLHETGHCLHHLFARVPRPSIAGINGFEWDAVEFPSQLMEDFAWDREVITAMSGHHVTGMPLPDNLYDQMLAGRLFHAGLTILRSVEFALFDLLLHLDGGRTDPMDVLDAVREEVAVARPPEWHRLPHSFSHVFAGGYAAGYYSYLWAELLAADGFEQFRKVGLIDRATGDRFREEVLSRGASRPAADSVRAFLNREPRPSAMFARHGLR